MKLPALTASVLLLWLSTSATATESDDESTIPTSTGRHLLSNQQQMQEQPQMMMQLQGLANNVPLKDAERRVWVQYKDGEHDACMRSMDAFTFTRSRSSAGGELLPPVKMHYDFAESNTFVVTATDEEIEILQADPAIENVEPDVERYLMRAIVEEEQVEERHLQQQGETIPYGIRMVQADQAWEQGVTGSGVKVCVIDTGIDSTHEDFVTSRLSGLQQSASPWQRDGSSHGTHVSGTIAAARNNGRGVVGVAPDAEIYTIRVFAGSNGNDYIWASGLVDAVNRCKAAGARVVNMSLGGTRSSSAENRAFERLFQEGMLIVAAAGNDGDTSYNYPASYDGIISVAAVDSNKRVAGFSQKNNRVDLAAPGVSVLSTIPMRQGASPYGRKNGTSMASPHVAGVAALLFSFKPDATTTEIRDAMQQSAEDLGGSGRDNSYGEGLVLAMRALEVLNGGPLSGPGQGPTTPGSCASGEIFVEIELQTDNYAEETSVALTRSDGTALVTGTALDSNRAYAARRCVSANDCYTFTITDSEGDGICCEFGQGSFDVNVDGQRVGGGGDFGFENSVSFGQCTPPSVDVGLFLRTDAFPGETRVTLTNQSTGERLWSYSFPEANTNYGATVSVDPRDCYAFEVTDTYADGLCCDYGTGKFDLSYNGLVVKSGAEFGSSVTYALGEGC
jgi:serine protease